MTRRAARLAPALVTALAIGAAVGVQGRLEAAAGVGRPPAPLLYLPSGKYLEIVSLGFDEILADVIYLWSIQYYGNYDIADRYLYLERIYGDVIAELDPHYVDPYLIGSLIMVLEAKQPESALRLLDKGIAANPDRWILPFEAGFIAYNDLRDYERAAGYFEKALRAPDVHPLVRRLHAEMRHRAGDKRASLREWAEILRGATDEYVERVAWNHVHALKVEVDLEDLQGALLRFERAQGTRARRLHDLVAAGLLAALPRDPEDRDYAYDAATGRVWYRGGGSVVR